VTAAGDPLDHLFNALADGTRRTVMRQLLDHGPATASALSVGLPISRQAVVKHLNALGRAGLVDAHREGREVRYRAIPDPMGDGVEWMLRAGARWDRRLERLRRQLSQRTG
jgi:DNA-binding transcriptional ArsR family regulator